MKTKKFTMYVAPVKMVPGPPTLPFSSTLLIERKDNKRSWKKGGSGIPEVLRNHLDPKTQQVFENFITKNELAACLQISRSLINKLMAEEGLPHLKIGKSVRFQLSKVQSWFQTTGRMT